MFSLRVGFYGIPDRPLIGFKVLCFQYLDLRTLECDRHCNWLGSIQFAKPRKELPSRSTDRWFHAVRLCGSSIRVVSGLWRLNNQGFRTKASSGCWRPAECASGYCISAAMPKASEFQTVPGVAIRPCIIQHDIWSAMASVLAMFLHQFEQICSHKMQSLAVDAA